ncbi:hypothetical protein CVV38_01810 [Candidatus Peregrinibacteria bacterium HGW-Peregrinibacteria-1]|jgi:hypothetical protein|nr:MAG: hypothetical protein CVV38_01810 [Candidatus Peregrinibacteria bacterium HGW-Peregrinibacteria-1]
MRFLKDSIGTWWISIVTGMIIFVSLSAFAVDFGKINDPYAGFNTLRANYHDEMNKYFNEKLEKLVEMVENDEMFYDRAEFSTPVNNNGITDASMCTADNVSSYCVSMGALDVYMTYVRTLTQVQETLDIDPEIVIQDLSVQSLMGDTTSRNNEIAQEIIEAEEIMEATMAAYNEFRMAYPMHIQYQEVLENLIAYRRKLRDLQFEVNRFPGKFINTTTLECR